MKQKIINFFNFLRFRNKSIVYPYTYKDLITLDEFYISNFDEKKYKYLKYIKKGATINFSYFGKAYNESLFKVCYCLKHIGKENKVRVNVLGIDDFIKFFKCLNNFDFIYLTNLDCEYDISLKDFDKYEKILTDIVSPAKNLSVFEKVIYAYNVTKLFKEYKESNKNKSDSRLLYRILNNDYMVCVGYSVLFIELLRRLNIKSKNLNVVTGPTLYEVKNNKISTYYEKISRHSRVLVFIKDVMYKIDGYYIFDPTFDSSFTDDLYNFFAVTVDEIKKSYLDTKSFYLKYFDIKSTNELFTKLEQSKKNNGDILNLIKNFDEEFIESLKLKYGKKYEELTKGNNNSMTIDIGNYIISKNNNVIDGKTLFKAIRNIYKLFYGYKEDKLDEVLENVRIKNMQEHNITYPRTLNNGEYVVNKNNKFNFKYLKKTKK